jgi:hypothetical protein
MRRQALFALIVSLLFYATHLGCSDGQHVPAQPEGADPGGSNADGIAFTSNHEGNPEIYVMNRRH